MTNKTDGRADKKSIFRFLGPGLVAGAADDDPSGIATYSQAGAQFGFGLLWTVVLTLPFMVVVQLVSARIGRVTGKGIAANLRETVPRPVLVALVLLLLVANTINIAADLAAMGEALQLVVGGGEHGHALVFGLASIILQIVVPYKSYAPILKWMTLVLFAYVATVFTVHIDWSQVVMATIFPQPSLAPDYLLVVVAVLGTTISPYLFFWQASQEVEEMAERRKRPLRDLKRGGDSEINRITIDTIIGMAFSNIIAFFIIVTTASTLFAHGIRDIQTSAQAAEALRPLAGPLTFYLFAMGIVGTGLLAVPVLAGSAAYAVAETFGWKATLAAKPSEAPAFYGIIAFATLVGVFIDFTPIDPIKMLFWSAVINGVVAVPMIIAIMLLVSAPSRMKRFTVPRYLAWLGWSAAVLMTVVLLALVRSIFV